MIKTVKMSDISPLIRDTLDSEGEVIFTITSCSMVPMLHHGREKVCIIKTREASLKKYDIPLFIRNDGKYILHRIIGVKSNGYKVIGDNQLTIEYPVLHSQVIGVVNGFWRNEKYISCENLLYKVYCRLWYYVYPIRWFVFRSKNLIRKLNI